MRLVRMLLVVGAAIMALTLIAPSALATSPKTFYLDKTCAPDPTEPLGYSCTVQHSDFKWIPPGTVVHYTSQSGNVVQATIPIKNGSASGACVWDGDWDAICTFDSGTGRLTQFHLEVVVTASDHVGDSATVWFWRGTYWFGGGH